MANISHFTQTVNGVSTTYDIHDAKAVPRSGGAVISGNTLGRTVNDSYFFIEGGTTTSDGSYIALYGKNFTSQYSQGGQIVLQCRGANGDPLLLLQPDGTAKWNNKNLAMAEDVVPRSGGAVITGPGLGRVDNSNQLRLCGGTSMHDGGTVIVYGKDIDVPQIRGGILFMVADGSNEKYMNLYPDGTWTWDGTACQITSDQRLKQQIAEIDDKLLDAWESVELCQFKYNDAVDQKGKDNARLHTGYVVQQIDKACKSHNVDISAYGLYCHEEYPEETEEVEVEQADGTKVKETKVIREANEHYSLRYTEVYAVECMYLRRCIARLTARIEQLEKEQEASK